MKGSMRKKYLVCPGYIKSKSDGDIHFIQGKQLIHLYRVNPEECYILKRDQPIEGSLKELIPLYPDYHGNYVIPEV